MRTSMIVGTVLLSFTASYLTAGENAPPPLAADAAWTVDKSNTLAYPDWLQLGREFRPELRSILSSEAGNLQYWIRVPKGARGTIAVAVGEAFWAEPGHRIMDIRIDGRVRASRIDPIAVAGGKHRLAVIACEAEDVDGDGLLHVQITASKDAPDHVTLAAGLWWLAGQTLTAQQAAELPRVDNKLKADLFICHGMDVSPWRERFFDGKSFAGWEGNLPAFRIQDEAIVGGQMDKPVPRNEYLCTTQVYRDFELRLKFRLRGENVNAGVQFRSERVPGSNEMIGYQADMGQHYWGCLYDERRHKLLAGPTKEEQQKLIRRDDWNDYVIRAEGLHVQLWLNGHKTVDYAEPDTTIPQVGVFGLQIHQGAASEAWYKDLTIKVLSAAEQTDDRAALDRRVQSVIDEVDKTCRDTTVYMIGPEKGKRLAELVRQRKPKVVVECGTAIGYSGLWIARELKAAGHGKLITLEIDAARTQQARENFRRAGLDDVVDARVGDARKLVREIKEPVDFLFIDCDYSNYTPCLAGIEDRLTDGAVVVADNVGIGAAGMKDYLDHVRSKYSSKTEWFDIDLPWGKRDAMEVTTVKRKGP